MLFFAIPESNRKKTFTFETHIRNAILDFVSIIERFTILNFYFDLRQLN